MINQRIFSANVGDISTGQAGPDAIETDIDNLLANDQELLGITGSKANLTTDDKTNLVAAINEHETQINDLAPHLSDLVTDADGVHGLKIENGTFTPYIFGTTTAGTHTYGAQLGFYHRIGKRVYFDAYIQVQTKDSLMSGEAKVGGLPFVPINTYLRRMAITIGRIDDLTYGTAKQIVAMLGANEPFVSLIKVQENASIAQVTATDVRKLIINLSGNYLIA